MAFQSDELLLDDDEFEGTQKIQYTDAAHTRSTPPPSRPTSTRRRFSDPDSDSKVQFQLEHSFGDSDFAPAGLFTARLKTSSHGGQVALCLCSKFTCFVVLFILWETWM